MVGRRPDGYHLLDSLVCFTELGDELHLSPAEALGLEIDGPFAPALGSTDNLTLKAARLLDAERGAALHLVKNLPVAAGIGGGSADAAAALVGLSRLWDLPPPPPAQSLALGADLPVCLAEGPSFVGGIGEELVPAPALPRAYLLLVNPRRPLPTIDVFRRYHRSFSAPGRFEAPPADARALAGLLAERRNDLTEAALELLPEIAGILAALGGSPGCLLARMSGSGATCFGLFESPRAAATAAVTLRGGGAALVMGARNRHNFRRCGRGYRLRARSTTRGFPLGKGKELTQGDGEPPINGDGFTPECSFFRFCSDLPCHGMRVVPRTSRPVPGFLRTLMVNFASRLMPELFRNSRLRRSRMIRAGFASSILSIISWIGA